MFKTFNAGPARYEFLQDIQSASNKITNIKRPYAQPSDSTPEFLLQESPRPGARSVRQRVHNGIFYTYGRSCSHGEDINFRNLIVDRKTIAINDSKDFSVGSEYDLKDIDDQNLAVALGSIVKRHAEKKSSNIASIKLSGYFRSFECQYFSQFKKFLKALTQNSGWENLQVLDLGSMTLNENTLPILEKAVSHNYWPALKALNLSFAAFEVEQENYPYSLFIKNMFSSTSGMLLEELSIGRGFADDQTLTNIALAIEKGILPNIRVLNLPTWNDPDAKKGLERLIQALSAKESSTVRILDLSGQNFSPEAIRLFTDAIRADKFFNLECLDLKDCNLDDTSLAALINAFCESRKFSSLIRLNLEKNEFLMLSGHALARAVKEKKMPWLQEIYLATQSKDVDDEASSLNFIKKLSTMNFSENSWLTSQVKADCFLMDTGSSTAMPNASAGVDDASASDMQPELPFAYDALLEALCDYPLWRLQVLSLKDLPISESVTKKLIENFYGSFLQLKSLTLVRCDINENHVEVLQDKFIECSMVNFISKYDLHNYFVKMTDEEKIAITNALMSEFEVQLPYDDRDIQIEN